MWKICNKNNKLCAMCIHWDGYRLGYVVHSNGPFFKYESNSKAKCMNPKDIAHFEKSPIQSCNKFESKF